MPRVLRDVLSGVINEQPDMAVLDGCVDVDALLGEVHRLKPDVVVLGLGGVELSAVCELALSRAPELKIIAIEEEGRRATLFELRPVRTPVGEPSLGGFLELIRSAVAGAPRGERSAPGGGAGRRGRWSWQS